MRQGISPSISPELLALLHRMGRGDEIVLADAQFPGVTNGKRVLCANGLRIADLLAAILPLFVLDSYVDYPVIITAAVAGDTLDPAVEASYRVLIQALPQSSALTALNSLIAPNLLSQLS
jgi:L-fucose mutarotase